MATLRGRLVDYSSRQPIKWLAVYLNDYSGASDENGYFAITAPEGKYTFRVRSLMYRPIAKEITLPPEGLDVGEVEIYRTFV